MDKKFKAKLTIIKGSNGHKLLDDLNFPYRVQGRNVLVTLNQEQFDKFIETRDQRAAQFAARLLG